MPFSEFAFYWIGIGTAFFVFAMLDGTSRLILQASGPIEGILGAALTIVVWPIMPMCWMLCGMLCVFDWCVKRIFGWSLFD